MITFTNRPKAYQRDQDLCLIEKRSMYYRVRKCSWEPNMTANYKQATDKELSGEEAHYLKRQKLNIH